MSPLLNCLDDHSVHAELCGVAVLVGCLASFILEAELTRLAEPDQLIQIHQEGGGQSLPEQEP